MPSYRFFTRRVVLEEVPGESIKALKYRILNTSNFTVKASSPSNLIEFVSTNTRGVNNLTYLFDSITIKLCKVKVLLMSAKHGTTKLFAVISLFDVRTNWET